MSIKSIIVVGNCQARPLSSIIEKTNPDIEVFPPIILHSASSNDRNNNIYLLQKADVILSQLTADNFDPAHLRTSSLRDVFSRKLLVWPNIFYAGEQPFTRYFTYSKGGRMNGPLEAMHDLRIYRSWLLNGEIDSDVLRYADPALVAKTCQVSLAALEEREKQTDIAISDVIHDLSPYKSLFFTFNHPKNIVLSKLAERLLEKLGLPSNGVLHFDREPLGRYRVPGIDFPSELQGDIMDSEGQKRIKSYSPQQLISTFQQVYDNDFRFRDIKNIRLTPLIGWEQEFLGKL